MLEQWISIAIVVVFNVGLGFYWSGKLEQKVKDAETANQKQFLGLETKANELFRIARDHERADQQHFGDTDMHWNRRERDWLNVRFEDMGKRFDTIETMIRSIKAE